MNKFDEPITVELVFENQSKQNTSKIFGYVGIANCSDSFPEGVVPSKDYGVVTLQSNQCLEIGVCESSSSQIDEILAEYEHDLKKIILQIGDDVKIIYPENFSETFEQEGNNFYMTIE